MPVEIDETRLGNLQTIAQIADGLLKNPKTRKQYLTAVKEAYPSLAIPEIDAAAPVVEQVTGLEKKFDEFTGRVTEILESQKTETLKRGIDRKVDEGRALLRSRRYTDDGIAKIEEMMTQEGIGDYNNAVKIWEFDHPLEAPARPSRGNMFDFIDETSKSADTQNQYVKELMATGGQDDNVLNRQISNVLREVRSGQ